MKDNQGSYITCSIEVSLHKDYTLNPKGRILTTSTMALIQWNFFCFIVQTKKGKFWMYLN